MQTPLLTQYITLPKKNLDPTHPSQQKEPPQKFDVKDELKKITCILLGTAPVSILRQLSGDLITNKQPPVNIKTYLLSNGAYMRNLTFLQGREQLIVLLSKMTYSQLFKNGGSLTKTEDTSVTLLSLLPASLYGQVQLECKMLKQPSPTGVHNLIANATCIARNYLNFYSLRIENPERTAVYLSSRLCHLGLLACINKSSNEAAKLHLPRTLGALFLLGTFSWTNGEIQKKIETTLNFYSKA